MNKSMKTVVAASVLAALMGSSVAMADMSANIGGTSNYVWRGITQSADDAAISGGLDYSHDSGIYVGTWTSSTAWGSSEVDLYGGFAKEFGAVALDVGLTRYAYPTNSLLNWTEAKVVVGFGPAKVTVARGDSVFGYTDVDSTYGALDLSHDLKEDLSVGLHVGYWKFSDPINPSIVVAPAFVAGDAVDTMTEYGVSLTKGDFTFTVSDSNLDKDIYTQDGQYRLYASYTKKFDL